MESAKNISYAVVLLFGLVSFSPVMADDSIQLHLKGKHYNGCKTKIICNEDNSGLGYEKEGDGLLNYMVGWYQNTSKKTSVYGGVKLPLESFFSASMVALYDDQTPNDEDRRVVPVVSLHLELIPSSSVSPVLTVPIGGHVVLLSVEIDL